MYSVINNVILQYYTIEKIFCRLIIILIRRDNNTRELLKYCMDVKTNEKYCFFTLQRINVGTVNYCVIKNIIIFRYLKCTYNFLLMCDNIMFQPINRF